MNAQHISERHLWKSLASSPYAQIVWTPWRRQGYNHDFLVKFFVAISLVIPALFMLVSLAVKPYQGFAWAAPCIALALLGLWMVQINNLVAQNEPIVAQLVPGQVHGLRLSAAALWLAHVAAQTLLLGLTFGHPTLWAWGTGITLLATAFYTRGPKMLTVAAFLALLMGLDLWFDMSPSFLYVLSSGLEEASLETWSLSLIGLVMGLAILVRLFIQNGDPKHVARYEKRKRWQTVTRQNAAASPSEALALLRPTGWWSQCYSRLYMAWFRRVVRTAQLSEHSALARLELVFGPHGHWTASLYSALFASLVLSATFLPLREIQHSGRFGGSVVFSILLNPFMRSTVLIVMAWNLMAGAVLRLSNQMQKSRKEQALLMLLPGVPQGSALNKGLARRQLMRWGVCWLFMCALIALNVETSKLTDLNKEIILALCLCYMPFGLLVLRDWSRHDQADRRGPVLFVLWILLAMPAQVACLTLWHWPSLLVSIAVLALCVGMGTYLWRRLDWYPQAFPVGTLARTPSRIEF